jgi:hypothetical protein
MRYMVRPDSRGEQMRCLKPSGGRVFVIRDDNEPPGAGGAKDLAPKPDQPD